MMTIPSHIFRAYDIRGIAAGDAPEVTPELARLVGAAYATFLAREVGYPPRVAVGHDDRLTGEMLSAAFIDGVIATGASVVAIGHATSPYLYFAVCAGRLDGGVNITASHNPGEYNGFKLTRAGSLPIAGEEIQTILAIANELNHAFPTATAGAIERADFREAYFAKLATLAPLARPLKVVIDCGNGTAGRFAPDFFRQLGCEVVELYCEPDGNFPNHLANPEEVETLYDLQKKVVELGADIGIAYDGDGDRAGIVDEQGVVHASDRLLVLLARDVLARQPGATIIFDVKCSNVLANEIKKAGGVGVRWKTGHSFIKRKMKEIGALLAGEVSGHMFFGENYFGVDDGLLASAKLAAILSHTSQPFSTLLADLSESFTTPELKLPVADAVKFDVMRALIDEFSRDFTVDTLDGVRFSTADGWGLIRASNTSPYLTCRCEAVSPTALTVIKKELTTRLAKYPAVDATALAA